MEFTINDIIARITDLATDKQWTMERLCRESGIRYSDFNRFIKGDKMISLNNLQKICKAFDISLSQFFTPKPLDKMIKVSDCIAFENFLKLNDNNHKELVVQFIDALISKEKENKNG